MATTTETHNWYECRAGKSGRSLRTYKVSATEFLKRHAHNQPPVFGTITGTNQTFLSMLIQSLKLR